MAQTLVDGLVHPVTWLLGTADKHCLVAIDEFQQILYYNDNLNVEAALRTQIQQCPNANFIFAGSQRHLMSEMFLSPARPFYQSVVPMSLYPISLERYWAFAQPQFAKNGGRKITYEVVESVYQRFDGITANMQRIMNMLYMLTPKGESCGMEMINRANFYLPAYKDEKSRPPISEACLMKQSSSILRVVRWYNILRRSLQSLCGRSPSACRPSTPYPRG